MAIYNLIGIYAVTPTMESIFQSAVYHGFDWLIEGKNEYADKINWSQFKNLGLVEVELLGDFSPEELNSISHNGQAPYLEYYLDSSGEYPLSEEDAIVTNKCRVCFFLHFIDISKPLIIGNGLMTLPPMKDLPGRLIPFTHYVPVD